MGKCLPLTHIPTFTNMLQNVNKRDLKLTTDRRVVFTPKQKQSGFGDGNNLHTAEMTTNLTQLKGKTIKRVFNKYLQQKMTMTV